MLPTPQAKHAVAFVTVETEPLPHVWHVVDVATSARGKYVPGLQSEHDVKPVDAVTWPAAHSEHESSISAAEALPCAHGWHV